MKILPQRETNILNLLQKQGKASIEELADAFGVSIMTIHRDLNKLEQSGLIKKKYGGAILTNPSASSSVPMCKLCKKPAPDRTAFLIRLESGEQIHACCAHCGLSLQKEIKHISQSLTPDFLRGHMVSASQAIFVIGSELNICCVPSALAFASKADAEKFKKGFGGEVSNANAAVHLLKI